MALHAVTDTAKFARLMKVLGISKYEALGILETLWHFTHRNTPKGDIGRFEDEEIADWIGWGGEAAKLIEGLVKAKWVDRDAKYRLIVHDWHVHASDATKLLLKRKGQAFAVPGEEVPQVVEPVVPTVSGQCRDTVGKIATVSGLPVPGAGAEPGAEPVPGGSGGTGSPPRNTHWDEFLGIYPKRSGNNATAKGRDKFHRLLKTGMDPSVILEGARRYRVWADATDKTRTDYVMQIPTWLNGKCWLEDWAVTQGGTNGKSESLAEQNERLAGELARRRGTGSVGAVASG